VFKRFLKDSFIYGIAGVLTRGISVILVPLYTRLLPPTEYGMVDIINVFGAIVGLTVALEISQAIARYYPATQDAEIRSSYASTALWFAVGAYSAFLVAAIIAAPELSRVLLDSPRHSNIIRIAVLSISASGIFRFGLEMLRWDLRPSRYSTVTIVSALAIVSGALLFVLVLRLGVVGVFYAMLAGNMAGCILAFYLGRKMYRITFDWTRCRELLHFSLPLVPSSIGVFVSLYIDRIAIKELMSLGDLGVFGVGYRVAAAVGFLMIGFQTALTPLIFTYYEKRETRAELARIFRYFVAFALLICLGLNLFAREVLTVFTAPTYFGAAAVIPILAPAVLLSSMSIFAPGLAIEKRTGTIATISIGVAGLNTVLNFSLIPVFGIRGAALATLISASLGFVTYMVLSQRVYYVPHVWGRLAFAAMSTVVLGAIASLFTFGFWWDTALRLILMIATVGVFVRLRLINTRDISRGFGRLRLFLRYASPSGTA